jgi:hypothetical protein
LGRQPEMELILSDKTVPILARDFCPNSTFFFDTSSSSSRLQGAQSSAGRSK